MPTKAMILAAGLGKRMRPLTDHTPKPLLQAAGKPLIQYPIERLREAGVTDILVNLAYLGDKIRDFLGTGASLGVRITYSQEPFPLETAGAIAAVLDWLGDDPFVLVNGDVWSDYPFARLLSQPLAPQCDGHLVMVANPAFNPEGDFHLGSEGDVLVDVEASTAAVVGDSTSAQARHFPLSLSASGTRLTYSGIGLLRPALVANYPQRRQKFPLLEVFKHAMTAGRLSGEFYSGGWSDIGTPERLQSLDRHLRVNGAPD